MTNLAHLKFYATQPHACSYLPEQRATTLFLDPQQPIDLATYSQLSDLGFRRSGDHLYRPHCQACSACIASRIAVDDFEPTYIFLIALGIQTFLPEETSHIHGRRWLIGLNLLWIGGYVAAWLIWPAQRVGNNSSLVIEWGNTLAHYLLGFPGGLMAAIGLRRQSHQTLDATLRRRIPVYLRLVEISAGLLGILHVLLYLPPPAFLVPYHDLRMMATEWLWVLVGVGLTFG
ncbi:MAG: hypothetical protein R6V43_13930, partial [Halopseudomonas sp.]